MCSFRYMYIIECYMFLHYYIPKLYVYLQAESEFHYQFSWIDFTSMCNTNEIVYGLECISHHTCSCWKLPVTRICEIYTYIALHVRMLLVHLYMPWLSCFHPWIVFALLNNTCGILNWRKYGTVDPWLAEPLWTSATKIGLDKWKVWISK